MMTKLSKINDSLPDLILGESIFCIIAELILFFVFPNRLYNAIGLMAGFITAVFWAYNMSRGLDKAVSMDEGSAVRNMQKGTALRYGVSLIVLGVLIITGFGNPITAFVGMMGLKLAAYASPLMHKIFRR